MKDFEREHILKTIKNLITTKKKQPKALEIGLSSLYRKMDELGIPTRITKEEN